uniref:Galectin n=1 Tax=Meloidogyne enterolobii TaxID=390850 RepID=A0A6V7XQE2_MELEN|nr:unnamed protein product [Meloidogyne enterolobii]
MTLCTKSPPPPPPPFCKGLIELNNLTIPSIIDLEEIGFRRGFIYRKLIIIHGTATEPTNFDVSLVEDGVPEETADIPFRFSVDFATKDVITDTWIYGKGWINKQRIESLPFTVGQEFELKFIAESKRHGLHVHVNERHFVSFYRSNLREITQLEIKGAIKVRSVNLCPD